MFTRHLLTGSAIKEIHKNWADYLRRQLALETFRGRLNEEDQGDDTQDQAYCRDVVVSILFGYTLSVEICTKLFSVV